MCCLQASETSGRCAVPKHVRRGQWGEMLSSPREAGPSDLGFLAFTTFLHTLIWNGIHRIFRSGFSSAGIVGISQHLTPEQQASSMIRSYVRAQVTPHPTPGCWTQGLTPASQILWHWITSLLYFLLRQVLAELLRLSSNLWSSCLSLPYKWNYRHMPPFLFSCIFLCHHISELA